MRTGSFSFNNRLQPVNISATSPTTTVFSLNYDFHSGNGDNGNVWGITNNKDATRNQSFIYDALNRLTSAQNAGADCSKATLNGKTEYWGNSYSYDAWGNLITKSATKCSAENLTLTALANNQLSGYTYDAAGNMTHDLTSGNNYAYDSDNRITGAAGFTYIYDEADNRVKKSNGSTGTLYWYMAPGIVAESNLAGNLQSEYVFFDGERVARKDFSSGNVEYYFSDNLKTASVITDASGNIKSESDYYPWGGELQFANGDSNHYKFTGKERDSETGLDYFGARYFSNGLGRFITPDWSPTPVPVPYADLTDPQSLNRYSYVRNLPTTKGDVDGHCPDGGCIVPPKSLSELNAQNEAKKRFIVDVGKGLVNAFVETVNFVHDAVSLGQDDRHIPTPFPDGSATTQVTAFVAPLLIPGVGEEEKGAQILAKAEKGAVSESRVLSDLGQAKNTEVVIGKEGKSIPDFQNSKTVGEIKDTKTVSNTKQLRIQKEAAQKSGRQHELHTGTKTHVTKQATQGTKVVRKDDLGPR